MEEAKDKMKKALAKLKEAEKSMDKAEDKVEMANVKMKNCTKSILWEELLYDHAQKVYTFTWKLRESARNDHESASTVFTSARYKYKNLLHGMFPSLPFPSLPFPSLPFPSLPFPSLPTHHTHLLHTHTWAHTHTSL